MKLQLRANTSNHYPLRGILIRGRNPLAWVAQLQQWGLGLHEYTVYPLPHHSPNSAWGCLATTTSQLKGNRNIGLNEFVQCVGELLFIPEKAQISPLLNKQQLGDLLQNRLHFLHPEIGLVALQAIPNWSSLMHLPVQQNRDSTAPAEGVFVPQTIRRFQVKAVEPEKVLEQLATDGDFPQKEKLEDKPLNLLEKGKLAFYEQLFGKDKAGGDASGGSGLGEGLFQDMDKISAWLGGNTSSGWMQRLQQDFEALAKRNQNELEKLMDLLKDNPLEALKYAIPLDDSGTSRGGTDSTGASFGLFKRWNNFGLFGNEQQSGKSAGGGGWSPLMAQQYWRLQQQYKDTALHLIAQGEYKKAAFVYLKLLKDYRTAAATLEQGGYYQEAASIYLKFVKDELKAAACYHKAHCLEQAIELYVKNDRNEEAGDLYMELKDRQQANYYYKRVVDFYVSQNQYVKASMMYRNKMEQFAEAQETLLAGWRSGYDAQNCLNQYFDNTSLKELSNAIELVYQQAVYKHNGISFLQVLKHQFKRSTTRKTPEPKPLIRQIAYEIVAEQLSGTPSVVNELRHFNPDDQVINKDILRYRLKNR